MAETSRCVQERRRRLTRPNKTRRDAVSRDSSDQTCRMRRREGRTGRAELARQAESNRSQIKVAAMDGPCRIVWRGWCWRPLCPPVHLNLNHNGRLPSTSYNLDPRCSLKPSVLPSDMPAQSMPVPAAALLICLNLCHLLPACHVVTGVLLQTVINTASSTLNCARRPFGRANACSSPKHCTGRQPTACSTTLALFSSFVIATLLEAAYLLGSLHKTARRPSHLLQTVPGYSFHHSSPHLPYWAQLPILQMKRLYPKLLEPL